MNQSETRATLGRPRGISTGEVVVLLVVTFTVALTWPMVLRQRKKADQTTAVSSCRGIGLCVYEFTEEYGSCPDDGTAAVLEEKCGPGWTEPGKEPGKALLSPGSDLLQTGEDTVWGTETSPEILNPEV